MKRLDECLQRAVDDGFLEPDLAAHYQRKYREVLANYERRMGRHAAMIAANRDVSNAAAMDAAADRHAKLRQIDKMVEQERRYAKAHEQDAGLLLVNDVTQAFHEGQAIQQSYMAGISQFLAEFSTGVLGNIRNKAYLLDVVKELHGQNTGNVAAKVMAQSVMAVMERARVRINEAGANIGKLADWGVPHRHDADKIRAAKADWYDEVYNTADWSRMIDNRTGEPFVKFKGVKPFREDVQPFLDAVYASITKNGWDSRFPGLTTGGRSMAGMRAEHRILHFRDGDAWLAYNEKFGSANPFDAIVQHLNAMARDTALMERFGPNAKGGIIHAAQVMERAANRAEDLAGKAHAKRVNKVVARGKEALTMFSHVTTEASVPMNAGMAHFMSGWRSLNVAAQLGSAVLSSATDLASLSVMSKAIGLNPGNSLSQAMRTLTQGMTPEVARDMGYIFETQINAGAAHTRFMGNIWQPELTSRITNTVLRVSGLNFWTDRLRVGMAITFGSDLAQVAAKRFDELNPRLQAFMRSRDFDADMWDAIRDPAMMYTDPKGGKHINGEWFRNHTSLPPEQAELIATRFGALVRQFQEISIPTASLRGRAWLQDKARAGTVGGELLLGIGMYKSFAASQVFNAIRILTDMPESRWSKARFFAGAFAAYTFMGALVVQLKEIANGRDPRPMDNLAFWGSAVLQGGGLGIFGDFFASAQSRTGGGVAETIMGPLAGNVGDVARLVGTNLEASAMGEETQFGRDTIELAGRYMPGNTLWYARLAFDRLVEEQFMQLVDPEAKRRFEQQMRRRTNDYGNAWWWRRGQTSPDRGPNLSAAAGGSQ